MANPQANQSLALKLPTDTKRSIGEQVFLQQLAQVAIAHTSYGPTTSYPTDNLYTGQVFFDTNKQTPVTWNGSTWVAAGNATLFTANSFLYGNANGSISSTSAATNGQLLIGSTGAAPVLSSILALSGIAIVNGPGTIKVSNTGVLSLSGTTGQIAVSSQTGNIIVKIDPTYIGQTSITTLGTITTGTWNGSIVQPAYGGTGVATTPTNGQLLIGNGSTYTVATLGSGSGISTSVGAGTLQINNTGVLSNVAGTGISVSGATGNVTITNTGVTSFTSNTGLSTNVSATGAVTVTNTGVTSNVAGTGISVSGATGAVTISTTTPTYAGFKAADLTSGNATLTADADLTLTLPVGTFRIQTYLAFYEPTLGTGGFQFDFNSGTATIGAINYGGDGYTTASLFNPGVTSVTTANQFATIATASGAPSWYTVQGYLNVTVAGTIAIRWAQNTISVNLTTLMKGSHFTATKIG